MFEHILLFSWQPSSPFQGGCPPFSSFLFTWTLAFSVSAVTWPFYLGSIGNHSLLGALIKETWYFSYVLSRHLTEVSACSGVGAGVKDTGSPLECSPVAQPRKSSTGGKFFKELLPLTFKASPVNPRPGSEQQWKFRPMQTCTCLKNRDIWIWIQPLQRLASADGVRPLPTSEGWQFVLKRISSYPYPLVSIAITN